MNLWRKPIDDDCGEELLELRNRNFTLDEVKDWIEEHGDIIECFRFFGVYKAHSQLYLRVGKPLLSMNTAGFMYVERAAKPIKESIL